MDATVVLYEAKWLVAEIVRLLHNLTTEEATALVDALVQREVAWIWSDADLKRVLKLGLTWRQQTLAVLLSEAGPIAVEDLVRWLEHPQVRDYRKVLRQLHRARQVEYDEAAQKVHLLPPGVEAAEAPRRLLVRTRPSGARDQITRTTRRKRRSRVPTAHTEGGLPLAERDARPAARRRAVRVASDLQPTGGAVCTVVGAFGHDAGGCSLTLHL